MSIECELYDLTLTIIIEHLGNYTNTFWLPKLSTLTIIIEHLIIQTSKYI